MVSPLLYEVWPAGYLKERLEPAGQAAGAVAACAGFTVYIKNINAKKIQTSKHDLRLRIIFI
jgi:hypothetical protein